MDVNAEVSAQLSLIDVLLRDLNKSIEPCSSKKNAKKEEENQDAMPDSTTNNEKSISNIFHCGDDVLVLNKDGRYYLGTIVELSTSNDNDLCDAGISVPKCLVKFGDGTHSWAPSSTLKLLSAPPVDDGRIMCVVCKLREGTASSPAGNAVIPCDMCGRGYHAKCHTPPVDAWITGASWHCRRCVDQRYRVAAAENRALKRAEFIRFKGSQHRRQQQELTPPCDTASTTSSTASDVGKDQTETHCYCNEKSDWLAQMLMCCRCSRWFHQRCVSSLRYPLYAGDKLYIFACERCNGGKEYLRRLELCWLELAHLALYNLTAYNAPNYFDLDNVIMPYIMDNWHALQLPEKMWHAPVHERRERILTALTASRKRFKCGREMKKRATIWGLRLRRPPAPPHQLSALTEVKLSETLTDELVRRVAPRLRFLPRPPSPPHEDSLQPTSSYNGKSSYKVNNQAMIVPVDSHWLNLMMGKRFHENLNSNSENDSTSSYESVKPNECYEESTSAAVSTSTCKVSAKDEADAVMGDMIQPDKTVPELEKSCDTSTRQLSAVHDSQAPCMGERDLPNIADGSNLDCIFTSTHTSKIATMNLEISKLSTKNIIEHSKIMSLQYMNTAAKYLIKSRNYFDNESSGDESSSRGTLDAIIPPLKNFQGKNNPFSIQNISSFQSGVKSSQFSVANKLFNRPSMNGAHYKHRHRLSLPMHLNRTPGAVGRPLKRQLSEKDLIIGPNGEVKRRKHRRNRKNLQMNQSCPLPTDVTTDNKKGDHCPTSTSLKLSGRRLRQRQEKNYYENARRNVERPDRNERVEAPANSVKSLKLSPHKSGNAPEADPQQLLQLKSSVQSYFGTATRIQAGEAFHIRARRRVSGGAEKFLIEWDTHGS